jgi:hypothetical protein
MKLKSKQTILSLLAGIIVALLIAIFLRPACWGPLVGIIVSAYLAKVSSPREGAIVGAIIAIAIDIYAVLQFPVQAIAKTNIGLLGNFVGLVLSLLLASGVGALYGLIIGKLFQFMKNNKIIF